MGHSHSTFGVQAGFLPASTEGWQLDPCILYGLQWGKFSGNTRIRKLLATASHGKRTVDFRHSNEFQLLDTRTERTFAENFHSDPDKDKEGGQLVHLPIPPWAIRKAGTQVRDPCIALRIPEDIWKLVAVSMSTADWARVSGTSKELSRVQLETLSIAPRSTAGIHWAAAHWREATIFAMTVRGWDTEEVMQLSATLKAACDKSRAPAMQHMRHIALHYELETLTICSDIHMKYQRCRKLDLAELKSLRCVSLQMVLPRGLIVPPGCQVHFVCHDIDAACEVWDMGLGSACTSCHLMELVSSEQAAGQPSLFESLLRIVVSPCPNLTVLKLNCSAVGSKEVSLVIGMCLPALCELEIRAVEDLHLWVTPSVSLESVTVCSEGLLHFEMGDLNRFVSGLKRFRYAYSMCHMVTHMLLWNLSEVRKWDSVENIDGSTEMSEAMTSEYSGVVLETSGCRDRSCGACIDCARRKHLPVSDNAEWPFLGLFAQPQDL
ncbi:hypothetical protein COCOBI_09-0380 [Coccomyxa sp. Obi]|nr:hypothetical protein COCOBI_09-0380 [Coccomyxa sp. Obi]